MQLLVSEQLAIFNIDNNTFPYNSHHKFNLESKNFRGQLNLVIQFRVSYLNQTKNLILRKDIKILVLAETMI